MQTASRITIASLAALFASVALAADPVKIGLVVPMSGPFAAYGKQIEHGVKLYLARNGDTFAGRKVQLILKDDAPGTSGDVSKRLSQELVVRDKVDVLAGFALTPAALASAPVSAEAKTPMVIMNAATSVITTRSPYIVRVSHTLPQYTAVTAEWSAKNNVKKVYTLVADFGPGVDAEGQFRKSFTAAGGEIVGSVRVPLNNVDFGALYGRSIGGVWIHSPRSLAEALRFI
jgi:branched-chain amino acid transport system substrate-binding protein